MQIIEARDVDLINPFPISEYQRILGWVRCYRSIPLTAEFPASAEALAANFAAQPNLETYGMVDKANLLGIRHEVPLIGLWTFQQSTPVNGDVHFVCTRKAFNSRLVDQAGQRLIQHIFDTKPGILRVSSSVVGKNSSAKSMFRKLGFRYEASLADAIITQDGFPQNLVIFGVTRKERTERALGSTTIEAVPREMDGAVA